MRILRSSRGFVLIAAIIACVILAALSILIIVMSTGDLKTTVVIMGNKKASAAAESGFHLLTQVFDPLRPNFPLNLGLGLNSNTWYDVDSANAPGARYNVSSVALSSSMPALAPPGYTLDNAGGFGMARFDSQLIGRDTIYNSEISVGVGLAYGPVSLKLIYQ